MAAPTLLYFRVSTRANNDCWKLQLSMPVDISYLRVDMLDLTLVWKCLVNVCSVRSVLFGFYWTVNRCFDQSAVCVFALSAETSNWFAQSVHRQTPQDFFVGLGQEGLIWSQCAKCMSNISKLDWLNCYQTAMLCAGQSDEVLKWNRSQVLKTETVKD